MRHARVFAVFPHFLPRIGGAEHHLNQVSHVLSQLGHEVSILVPRMPGSALIERHDNVTVLRFGDDSTSEGHHLAFRQILDYISQANTTNAVLYLAACTGSYARTRTKADILDTARKKGMPRVIRITSSNKIAELEAIYPPIIEGLRCADSIITLNDGIERELLDAGIARSRITKIPNGVDVGRFTPSNDVFSVTQARNRIVFFSGSRFVSKKKIGALLTLWSDAQDVVRQFNYEVSLRLLGDDFQETTSGRIYEEVKEEISTKGLTSITLLPAAAHADMPNHLRQAHVYISLSTQEGMSNAMLEAMACGLIVLVPKTPASEAVVIDRENGFLFEPDDLNSAREAIYKLLNSAPSDLAAIREQNIKVIHDNYTIEKIGRMFSQHFDSLLTCPV